MKLTVVLELLLTKIELSVAHNISPLHMPLFFVFYSGFVIYVVRSAILSPSSTDNMLLLYALIFGILLFTLYAVNYRRDKRMWAAYSAASGVLGLGHVKFGFWAEFFPYFSVTLEEGGFRALASTRWVSLGGMGLVGNMEFDVYVIFPGKIKGVSLLKRPRGEHVGCDGPLAPPLLELTVKDQSPRSVSFLGRLREKISQFLCGVDAPLTGDSEFDKHFQVIARAETIQKVLNKPTRDLLVLKKKTLSPGAIRVYPDGVSLQSTTQTPDGEEIADKTKTLLQLAKLMWPAIQQTA